MRAAPDPSGAPKRSPSKKPWPGGCRWDSSLSLRDLYSQQHGQPQSRTPMRQTLLSGVSGLHDDSRHRPGGERRKLTSSVFSGRSRRTARLHHRRSKPSAVSRVGEHFVRGDHFANLHPICSPLQGQAIQQLLTAMTCAYSPARGHRVLSTAAHNRGALRVQQDAAPTLTCGNEKPQAGVGAVAHRWVPFGAVEGRSVHPVAPNLLPRSRARDRVLRNAAPYQRQISAAPPAGCARRFRKPFGLR